jgi:hypothetical protein
MNSNAKLKKLLELRKKRKRLEAHTREQATAEDLAASVSNLDLEEIKAAEKPASPFTSIEGMRNIDVLDIYENEPHLFSETDKQKIRNYQSSRRNRCGMGPYGWMF